MARPRTLTADDVDFAVAVLLPKLQTFDLQLREAFSYKQATNALNEVSLLRPNGDRALALFAWSEKYLEPTEWTKLKAAIRKRRQRKRRLGQTEVVTVSKKSHELLRKISKRDNVTYSETLEYYLALAWKGKAR